MASRSSSSLNRVKGMRWEYRLLFVATYPGFFVAALVDRALHAQVAHAPARSLFSEAAALANNALPYAFTG